MLDRIHVLIGQNFGLKQKVLCEVERHLHTADARCQSLRPICLLVRYKQKKSVGPRTDPWGTPESNESGKGDDWLIRTSCERLNK
jgi:hypothetical protein